MASHNSSRRTLPLTIFTVVLALAVGLGGFLAASAATFTDQASVTDNVFTTDTLDPPTDVTASTGTAEGTIDLSWTATVDTYASGYRVLRSATAGGPYSQIDEVTPQSATSYQDSGLNPGTMYYYVLRSFFQNWESADSDEASAAAPGVLNVHKDYTMSDGTFAPGSFQVKNGETNFFTATSTVTSASNDIDWTLILVLKDKPEDGTTATVTVWWQNGGACSGGAVPGQIFASGSVTVPIAVVNQGVTLTVAKVGGSVSHTFVGGDLLCMSMHNNGTAGQNDIAANGDTASTSGTPGVSRLAGSFSQ